MTLPLTRGALCRLATNTPARYVSHGFAVAICSQDNDLMVDEAFPAIGGEELFPVPTEREIEAVWGGVAVVAEQRDTLISFLRELAAAPELAEPVARRIDAVLRRVAPTP